jgi:ribosomal protein S21
LEGILVMQVSVRDNDINSALRVLKRKMQREGTFRDMKRRRAYEETIGAPRPREGRSDPASSQDAPQAARAGRLSIGPGVS